MPANEAITDDLAERLAERLREPLPGRTAQALFEPELSYGRHFGPPPADARQAVVLVCLYPHAGQWYLPLTIRPTTMVVHAGQISLPGGRVEAGETSDHAALREFDEELGVPPAAIHLIGQLSPLYLFGSNFQVTPWVGIAHARPNFHPHSGEVAELLEVPLEHLRLPANRGVHARRHYGVALTAPHFTWGRHRIWGATSMILSELVEMLNAKCEMRSAK